MGRFLALILTCLISLSLTAGTAARAAEPIRCVGSDAAAHLGYADDVREQVPSEDDQAAAHHHGSCQGEQVGEPEIGRAPCRGRVCQYVSRLLVAVSLYKNPLQTEDPCNGNNVINQMTHQETLQQTNN